MQRVRYAFIIIWSSVTKYGSIQLCAPEGTRLVAQSSFAQPDINTRCVHPDASEEDGHPDAQGGWARFSTRATVLLLELGHHYLVKGHKS